MKINRSGSAVWSGGLKDGRGAISTQSEAWPGTGRNPRAVLPMNVASCGCRASRKQ